MPNFRYLVLGGGGVAVCVFAGAFAQLAREPSFSYDEIQEVTGCSAGAIAALLFSMNLSPSEMYQKLMSIDFKKMEDRGFAGKIASLWRCFAMYKGKLLADSVKEFLTYKIQQHKNQNFPITREMVKGYKKIAEDDPAYHDYYLTLKQEYKNQAKPSPELETVYEKMYHPEKVTFADLKLLGCKDLNITTTKYFKIGEEIRSEKMVYNWRNAAKTSVVLIMRASCAAPMYLECVRLLETSPGEFIESKHGHVNVDGGLSRPFELSFHDVDGMPNDRVLGLGIYHKSNATIDQEPEILRNNKPKDFILAGLHALQTNNISTEFEKDPRAIMMSNEGIPPFNFRVTSAEKERMVQSGIRGVKEAFQRLRLQADAAHPPAGLHKGSFWNKYDEALYKKHLLLEAEKVTDVPHHALVAG